MNSKQSISVLLMLGMMATVTACGETKEGGEGTSSPQVSPSAVSPAPTTASPSPKSEGGEGGEGK